MSDRIDVQVKVNGVERSATVEGRRTLAEMLREDLGLTGTHLGCEHGVCGACTVLIDGKSARSCLTLAAQAQGREITTIEGLADGDQLNPLQEAMRDNYAFQCGFCTPGFLMQITELLQEGQVPSEHEVREVLSGNICRCTGYETIVNGVLAAARR
ncbi:MAG: (2Fe-2S)-binding protein [Acidimicrobiaceae bacterium]|nr:(2Fe-2S)-binding protein [Acidimicrobiaceae bacterium]